MVDSAQEDKTMHENSTQYAADAHAEDARGGNLTSPGSQRLNGDLNRETDAFPTTDMPSSRLSLPNIKHIAKKRSSIATNSGPAKRRKKVSFGSTVTTKTVQAAADTQHGDTIPGANDIVTSSKETVRGYRGDYIFRCKQTGRGDWTVIRHTVQQRVPAPPLQPWEGSGVLMNGQADPCFNFPSMMRSIVYAGVGQDEAEVSGRVSGIASKRSLKKPGR